MDVIEYYRAETVEINLVNDNDVILVIPNNVTSIVNVVSGNVLWEQIQGAPNFVLRDSVYVDIKNYGADPTGQLSSSAIINELLLTHDHVVLANGTYLIDSSINITDSAKVVTVEPSAIIEVPSGYTGTVFKFGGGASMRGSKVDGGGFVQERGKTGGAAIAPGNWTGVEFSGNGVGTTACNVSGLTFRFPGTFVRYVSTSSGWANGNRVNDCQVFYFKNLVEVVKEGSQVGFSGNSMQNIMGQAGNYTEFGIKGLTGRGWTFIDVSPWDLHLSPSAIGCQILSNAEDIRIIGGMLTWQNYSNMSAPGQVVSIDSVQMRPWEEEILISAPETTSPTATYGVYEGYNVCLYPGSGFSSGFVGMVRVPPRAVRVSASLILAGAAEGDPGNVRMRLYIADRNPGGTILGGQSSRTFISPIEYQKLTESDFSDSLPVAANSYMRFSLDRTANDVADTLAGNVGVLGIRFRFQTTAA